MNVFWSIIYIYMCVRARARTRAYVRFIRGLSLRLDKLKFAYLFYYSAYFYYYL